MGEQHSVGVHQDFAALAQFFSRLLVDAVLLIRLIEVAAADQICRLPVELLVAASPAVAVVVTTPSLLYDLEALFGEDPPAQAQGVEFLDVAAVLVGQVADQVGPRGFGAQLAAEVAEVAAQLVPRELVRALGAG